jgi:hypothetical protein
VNNTNPSFYWRIYLKKKGHFFVYKIIVIGLGWRREGQLKTLFSDRYQTKYWARGCLYYIWFLLAFFYGSFTPLLLLITILKLVKIQLEMVGKCS